MSLSHNMNSRKQPSFRKYSDNVDRMAKIAERNHRRSLKETAYLNTFTEEEEDDEFLDDYGYEDEKDLG